MPPGPVAFGTGPQIITRFPMTGTTPLNDRRRNLFLLVGFLAIFASGFAALGDRPLLADPATPGAFPLVAGTTAAPLFVAAGDWPGVIRAAADLQADIERVSGQRPEMKTGGPAPAPAAVIIGTVGRSPLIDGLVAAGKLNVDAIRGEMGGLRFRDRRATAAGGGTGPRHRGQRQTRHHLRHL